MSTRQGKPPLDESVDVGFDPTVGLDDTRVGTVDDAPSDGTATGAYAVQDVLPQGREIAGRYKLERVVGRGGFGEVWAARDRIFDEPVAVKLQKLADGSRSEWSRREVATLGLLQLPGVAALRDEGVEDNLRFVVMDLVDGRPFPGLGAGEDLTATAWSWDEIAPATLSMLDALGRVHAYGVVHRDLKPENVLVDASGHATLLDFGVAFNPDLDSYSDRRMAGTPRYLSPEQVRGRGGDPRSDLYAVGVMLFNALSGRWPHDAPDRDTLFQRKLSQPARPLRTAAPDVPQAVAEVVDRLLQFRSSDRPGSVAELVAALKGADYVDPIEALTGVDAFGDVATVAELRGLFAGSDRLSRVPTHAAEELHRRTQGDRERVRTELSAWVRSRIARIEGGRVLIERPALERLEAGLRVAPRPRPTGDDRLPDGPLVTALGLADGQLTVDEIASAMQRSVADVARMVDELVHRGVADRYGDAARLRAPEGVARRDDVGRVCASLVGSLPRHDLRRLRIAVAAGSKGRVRETALDVARAAIDAHETESARAAARVGVELTLRGDDGPIARELRYYLCLGWAFVDTRRAKETAIYLAQQERGAVDPRWAALEPAVRASLTGIRRGGEQALQVLKASRHSGDPTCDGLRMGLAISVCNQLPLGRHDEVIAIVEPRVEGHEVSRARAAVRARRAYREGNFEQSAHWYERAAYHTGSEWPSALHLANAASAAMEAGKYDVARRMRRDALDAMNHSAGWSPLVAMRLEWLDRLMAYRSRAWGPPDLDLVAAIVEAPKHWTGGLMLITEAMMAIRGGDVGLGRDLVARGSATMLAGGLVAQAVWTTIAHALRVDGVSIGTVTDALDAEKLPPLIEAQVLRILHGTGDLGDDALERANALCTSMGVPDDMVREMLTIAECRGAPLPWQ